jgi:hypothetical protein
VAIIIAEFPVYSDRHFYYYSFREGGLTAPQITKFYELAIKRDYERRRVAASLQGVKYPTYEELIKQQKLEAAMRDPDSLTDEEKEEATKEIKKRNAAIMSMFPSSKR